MKRLLAYALLPAALATLAGCGATACTSNPATPANNNPQQSCTFAANTTATITIQLCGKCTDISPSCQPETVNSQGAIDLGPTVQQCEEQAGCNIQASCGISSVTCTVTIPAGAGPGDIFVNGTKAGTFTIGSGTSCAI